MLERVSQTKSFVCVARVMEATAAILTSFVEPMVAPAILNWIIDNA